MLLLESCLASEIPFVPEWMLDCDFLVRHLNSSQVKYIAFLPLWGGCWLHCCWLHFFFHWSLSFFLFCSPLKLRFLISPGWDFNVGFQIYPHPPPILDIVQQVGVTDDQINVLLMLTRTLRRDLISCCCSVIAPANVVANLWMSSCSSFATFCWCSFIC